MSLDQIRARASNASTGPWAVDRDDFDGASVYMDDGITWGRAYICTDLQQGDDGGEYDANFIAHARQDVPALLAAVDAVLALHSASARDIDELGDNAQCDGCLENDPGGFLTLTLSNCPTRKAITRALETK